MSDPNSPKVGDIFQLHWSTGYMIGKTARITQKYRYWKKLPEPVIKEGERFEYVAAHTIRDIETGEFDDPKTWWICRTQADAERIVERIGEVWAKLRVRSEKRAAKRKAEAEQILRTKPPANCAPATVYDFKKQFEARCKVLAEQFPTMVQAKSDGKSNEEIYRAYLIDLAANTGKICAENVAGDADFIRRLTRALDRFEKRSERTTVNSMVDAEIARGWICERYIYMPEAELAKVINDALGLEGRNRLLVNSIAIRRRRALELFSRQNPGRKDTPY